MMMNAPRMAPMSAPTMGMSDMTPTRAPSMSGFSTPQMKLMIATSVPKMRASVHWPTM